MSLVIVNGDGMGLSVSHLNKGRMDMLLSCSWRYWRTYDDGSQSASDFQEARAAFLGSVLHNALEHFYNEELSSKGDLLRMYDEEVERSPLPANDYTEGREMLEEWHKRVFIPYQDQDRTTIGSEVQFGYSQRFDSGEKMVIGGVPIHGFIDRVDEVVEDGKRILEVVDYKSNRAPKSRAELEDLSNAEVNIYLIAARKMFPGYDEYRFVYDMLRFDLFSTTRTKEELVNYLRFMKRVYNYAMSIDEPKQSLGSGCTWCDYKDECEQFTKAVENGVRPGNEVNFDNLAEIAEEHSRVSALASGLYRRKAIIEDSIRGLLLNNDLMSYDGEGFSVGLKARRTSEFDSKIVVEELKDDHPEILSQVVSVGKGKLEKMISDLPIEKRDRIYRTMKKGFQKSSINIKADKGV